MLRTPVMLLVVFAIAMFVPASTAPLSAARGPLMEMYVVSGPEELIEALEHMGFDVFDVGKEPDGPLTARVILAAPERHRLEEMGLRTTLWLSPEGLTASAEADRLLQQGFNVWRPFDGPDGLLSEMNTLAAEHPELVERVVYGQSVQGRELVALRVTEGGASVPQGSRPGAIYLSLQHAREWISGEVNRRLLRHFVEGYGSDPEITQLLSSVELWFVPVVNPDGYQHTFLQGQRLWRKNLADNDGDGEITGADGVDLNRNFSSRWNYDREGSSGSPTSLTYRGPIPASEPETSALQDLFMAMEFRFAVNYHSVASLLLYPLGWQDQTYSVDDPIFQALSGTAENPAIPGFVPMVSAGLYITNGETCDFAYAVAGTLCWTPELSDRGSGGGFVFPDNDADVQAEFLDNLPFALDVAKSTASPWTPASHLGNTTDAFVPRRFSLSYGSPQRVRALANRSLGEVNIAYRIGDGEVVRAPTTEWQGGSRFGGEGAVWYQTVEGVVKGARPGDQVEVWFEAGQVSSEPFTYSQHRATGRRILVIAAEDYTGILPVYPDQSPRYLDGYLADLQALGYRADVYDIDAHGRQAPDALGVLGHYQAIIWYTGDDIQPRLPTEPPGSTSRWVNDLQLALRDYLNEGGRLLTTGKYAVYPIAAQKTYPTRPGRYCNDAACARLVNDFMQYYLGANNYSRGHTVAVDVANEAGTGKGLFTQGQNNADIAATASLDLTGTESPVALTLAAVWDVENGFDYVSVEVRSTLTETWRTIPDADGHLTDADPNGRNPGWGLTGRGAGTLAFDLSDWAGHEIDLRFRYTTDRGVLGAGIWIDDVVVSGGEGELLMEEFEGEPLFRGDGWGTVPRDPPPDYVPLPVTGAPGPFEGLTWSFGEPGDTNQDHSAALTPISRVLPPEEYPHFASAANAAVYAAEGSLPRTGNYWVTAGQGAYTYQRLSRVLDLSSDAPSRLKFWASWDLRDPFDAVFVEARPVGTDEWTTLPDTRGNTSPGTALSCDTDTWFDRHPHLSHYMRPEGEGDQLACVNGGTTGEWHAASGQSGGWVEWDVDLSDYSGGSVEVSISLVRSRLVLPGLYLDDVDAAGDATSFEDGLDGWTIGGAPEGSPPNEVEYARGTLADLPTAAVVTTDDTVTFGFGLEGVRDTAARRAVLERALGYLLRDREWRSPVYLPALTNRPDS